MYGDDVLLVTGPALGPEGRLACSRAGEGAVPPRHGNTLPSIAVPIG